MNPSRTQGYGQSPQAGQASPYNSNQASGYSGTNVSDQAGAQGSQGRGGSYNQGGDKQNQGGDEQQQSSEGDGSGYKADGAADQSKAVGKASPSASGVKVSKYPQDAQHSETMAALHKVAQQGYTEDHIHSFVHLMTLLIAMLAHHFGMTAGHYKTHEEAKAAHKGAPPK